MVEVVGRREGDLTEIGSVGVWLLHPFIFLFFHSFYFIVAHFFSYKMNLPVPHFFEASEMKS